MSSFPAVTGSKSRGRSSPDERTIWTPSLDHWDHLDEMLDSEGQIREKRRVFLSKGPQRVSQANDKYLRCGIIAKRKIEIVIMIGT